MKPTDASSLSEQQKMILLAALVQDLRPNPDGRSANCSAVLLQVFRWIKIGAEEEVGLSEAWNADREHPVIDEWYQCLQEMGQSDSPEEPLLDWLGNTLARPHYTSCYLTTRSEPIAEQLLEEWMQRDWSTCSDYRVMLCYLSNKASQRQLLQLACASCRRALNAAHHSEIQRPLDALERFIEGKLARTSLRRYLREASEASKAHRESEIARLTRLLSDHGAFESAVKSMPPTVLEKLELGAERVGTTFRDSWLSRTSEDLSEECCSAYRAVEIALCFGAHKAPILASEVADLIETNVNFFVNQASPLELQYLSEPPFDRVARRTAWRQELQHQCDLIRCLVGNPFRPVTLDPHWLERNENRVSQIAHNIRENQHWGELLILADALEEAGCRDNEILEHCRNQELHARRCWVIDLLTEKHRADQ